MIKNYTTSISPLKTASEIDYILSSHGARKIMKEYAADGSVESLSFSVLTPQGEVGFRLPANVDGVLQVLENEHAPKRDRAQAERVAWRIVKDWVDAQMALLEAQMVQLEEIFLPYLIMPDNQTLYEAYKNEQLKLTE